MEARKTANQKAEAKHVKRYLALFFIISKLVEKNDEEFIEKLTEDDIKDSIAHMRPEYYQLLINKAKEYDEKKEVSLTTKNFKIIFKIVDEKIKMEMETYNPTFHKSKSQLIIELVKKFYFIEV